MAKKKQRKSYSFGAKRKTKKKDKSWIWPCALIGLFFIFTIVTLASRSLRSNSSYQATLLPPAEIKLNQFYPPTLKSLIVNPDSKTNYFDFILDSGDNDGLWYANQIRPLAKELINYFFLGITLPSEDFWVNLNAIRQNEITNARLALTDVGKILLEADLKLKKDTSRFTDPRHSLGREYWTKLQKELYEQGFNNRQLPIGNRLWIIPGEAIVEEDGDKVSIVKSTLKVCLDQEYLSYQNGSISLLSAPNQKEQALQDITGRIMRETILSKIEDEVNYGQAYAPLRQVYNSLILAEYFKRKYWGKQSLYSRYVNRGYIQGLESQTPWDTYHYFQAYVTSAQEGEYRLAQEEYDPFQMAMVQKYYFYGGVTFMELGRRLKIKKKDASVTVQDQSLTASPFGEKFLVSVPKPNNPSNPWELEDRFLEVRHHPSGAHVSEGKTPIRLAKAEDIKQSQQVNPAKEALAELLKLQATGLEEIEAVNDMAPYPDQPTRIQLSQAIYFAETRQLFLREDGKFHLFGGGISDDEGVSEDSPKQLIDKQTGQIVHSWQKRLSPAILAKLIKKHPQLILKNHRIGKKSGVLSFGDKNSIATFGKDYADSLVEAYIERGIEDEWFVTRVEIKENPTHPDKTGKFAFSQLVDRETGQIVHTWWRRLTSEKLATLIKRCSRPILKDHKLDSTGQLSVGKKGVITKFGKDYADSLVDAHIEKGIEDEWFVTRVEIKENPTHPDKTGKFAFSQLVDRETGQIVHTWRGEMLFRRKLAALIKRYPSLILNHRLTPEGLLSFGGEQIWTHFGKDYANSLVEVDIEKGIEDKPFVTKVEIKENPTHPDKTGEFVFSQLVDKKTSRMVYTWRKQLFSSTLDELIKRYPSLIWKNNRFGLSGALSIGGKGNIAAFGEDYANSLVEVDIERGIEDEWFVTGVEIKENPTHPDRTGEFIFSQLADRKTGLMVHTWWGAVSPERLAKLIRIYPSLILKNHRLNPSGALAFGGEGSWLNLRQDYANSLVEADIEKGIDNKPFLTKVEIKENPTYTDKTGEFIFSQLVDSKTSQIVHVWWGSLSQETFEELSKLYPRLILKRHTLGSTGALDLARQQRISFSRFPLHEVEAEFENGDLAIVYIIWEENGEWFKSRVGPGYGKTRRKLFTKEENFKDLLSQGLREKGMEEEQSKTIAETLVRFYRNSLDILVEHEFITRNMRDAIINLDISKINTQELAQKLKDNINDYRQLGFSESVIKLMIKRHLLPAKFIEYLQRKYRLGRSTYPFGSSWLSSNPEAYIKHRRELLDKRGTLDREKHLRLYNPDKAQILNREERLALLKRLKTDSEILGILLEGEQVRIEYDKINLLPQGVYQLTVKTMPRQLRQGDTLYLEDFPFVLKVVKGTKNSLIVTEESGSELEFPKRGILTYSPLDITCSVQKDILDRAISNLSASDLNTTGFRGIDRTLRLVKEEEIADLNARIRPFFDTRIKRKRTTTEDGEEIWVGDESQEVAVRLALSNSRTTIVHGPAATGKTSVIAEMIRHFVKQGKKVLLVSQMNQAVDNALADVIDDVPALRIGNNAESLLYGTERVWIHNREAVGAFEKGRRKGKGGFLFAATNIGIATDRTAKTYLRGKEFDVVIMDESSRETMIGSFVPFQYLRDNGKLILVGDTAQLKPFKTIEQEDLLRENGIKQRHIDTFFTSILSQVEGKNVGDEVLLSTNWRSHPLISGMLSEVFYDGAIQRRGWEDFTPDTLSLKVIDVGIEDGKYFEQPIGKSYQNTKSAMEIMNLLEHYIQKRGIRPEEITIVVALKPQEELLKRLIQAKYTVTRPRVTTIDSYQGGENNTVIIDFVRSNPQGNIGFIKEMNRLLVALSRAKENMAIVWDSRVFMREPEQVLPEDREVREALRKIQDYYIKEVWRFFPEELPPIYKALGVKREIADKDVSDLGAQVSNVKNLDRLLRILNVLRRSKDVPEVAEEASDRKIIEFALSELGEDLIEETQDDYGNRVIKIKEEAKDNPIAQVIQRWAINPQEGAEAINFQGQDGTWRIVGFEIQLNNPDTLDHEQREVAYRKQGLSWIEAHNQVVRDTGRGGLIDLEEAKQYAAAGQDVIGAGETEDIDVDMEEDAQVQKILSLLMANYSHRYMFGTIPSHIELRRMEYRKIASDFKDILVNNPQFLSKLLYVLANHDNKYLQRDLAYVLSTAFYMNRNLRIDATQLQMIFSVRVNSSDEETRNAICHLLGQALIRNPFLVNSKHLQSILNALVDSSDENAQLNLAFALSSGLNHNPVLALEFNDTQLAALLNVLARSSQEDVQRTLVGVMDLVLSGNPALNLNATQLERFLEACNRIQNIKYAREEVGSVVLNSLYANPALTSVVILKLAHEQTKDLLTDILIDIVSRFIQQLEPKIEPEALMLLKQVSAEAVKKKVFDKIIEPLFFKKPELFSEETRLIEELRPVYAEDVPAFKYLLFYRSVHQRGSPEYDLSLFPHQSTFKRIMSAKGEKKVLVVHNISDGLGDELIRNSTLIQALLDLNDPELKIVVYSNRPYIYCEGEYKDDKGRKVYRASHDQIIFRPLRTYGDTSEEFIMIIHHYDAKYTDRKYGPELEAKFVENQNLDVYKKDSSRIYIKTNKVNDRFTYEQIFVGGEQVVLPEYRGNNYNSSFRLCAELGLAFRHGAHKSMGRPSFFTAQSSKSAESYWEKVVMSANSVDAQPRPVAIFNGFGGETERKGYGSNREGQEKFRGAIREVISEGFFVVVLLNNQEWGKRDIAKSVIDGLTNQERRYVIIAPSPSEEEEETNRLIQKEERPYLYKYLVSYADLVITVEGGLMHLAYNIGNPFIVLTMPGSGRLDQWMSGGSNSLQGVIAGDRVIGVGIRDVVEKFNSAARSTQFAKTITELGAQFGEDKDDGTPPKPHFGHSGNEVDAQFIQAQRVIQAGHVEEAQLLVKEAIRLLREVDFEELDSSGLPVADMINQTEVAIWVLEQLQTRGSIDIDTLELLRQLQIGKNGLELKQALGYRNVVSKESWWDRAKDRVRNLFRRDKEKKQTPEPKIEKPGGIDFRKIKPKGENEADSSAESPEASRGPESPPGSASSPFSQDRSKDTGLGGIDLRKMEIEVIEK